MNAVDREELDWLAFRYIAGELAPEEHDDFEQRLAHDQAARDAVADAVALTQAIRAAEPVEPVPARPVPRRRFRWSVRFAACLSACLLAALAGYWLQKRGENHPTGLGRPVSNIPAELGVVWNEARLELAEQESDAWGWMRESETRDWPVVAEGTAALAVPDWVFSAVVAIEGDGRPAGKEDG